MKPSYPMERTLYYLITELTTEPLIALNSLHFVWIKFKELRAY